MKATGWQPHSVRGFLAGVVRKRLKLKLGSKKVEGNRVYQIASDALNLRFLGAANLAWIIPRRRAPILLHERQGSNSSVGKLVRSRASARQEAADLPG